MKFIPITLFGNQIKISTEELLNEKRSEKNETLHVPIENFINNKGFFLFRKNKGGEICMIGTKKGIILNRINPGRWPPKFTIRIDAFLNDRIGDKTITVYGRKKTVTELMFADNRGNWNYTPGGCADIEYQLAKLVDDYDREHPDDPIHNSRRS